MGTHFEVVQFTHAQSLWLPTHRVYMQTGSLCESTNYKQSLIVGRLVHDLIIAGS